MTTYIKKPTQEEAILQLLRERGSSGVKSWEIQYKQKSIHIGMFDDLIEAAKARDSYAKKLWGEYAVLNFSKREPVQGVMI